MKNRTVAATLALLVIAFAQAAPKIWSPQPSTPPMVAETTVDPIEYLVQAGPSGLAKSTDMLTERRHDWPPPGWEASESVLLPDGSVLQTFSFAPWHAITPANGDGGQIAFIGSDGYVRFTMTRDGGKPYLQCFRGGTGWIVFGRDVISGSWKELVATLTDVDCASTTVPPGLNQAMTRYRLESVAFKFLIDGRETTRTLATIIAEHYDNASIDTATALERSYFAKGYGLIRWETWGRKPAAVDLSARYFPVDYSVAPAPGWLLNDIRTFTVVVPTAPTPVPALQ